MTGLHLDLMNLLPEPSADEIQTLRASLLDEGCRDPLQVTPAGLIIDGCQRYLICTELHIPYQTEQIDVTEDEARLLRIQWQIARRNLSPYNRARLALQLREIVQNSDRPGRTNAKLAALSETSHDTVHRVRAIEEHAPEYVKIDCRRGILSTNAGYTLMKAYAEQPDEVQRVVLKYEITQPETVEMVGRLHADKRETFEELRASGYIQPGEDDEAVSIHASPARLEKALNRKARDHARMAVEAKRIATVTGRLERTENGRAIFILDGPLAMTPGQRARLDLFYVEDES